MVDQIRDQGLSSGLDVSAAALRKSNATGDAAAAKDAAAVEFGDSASAYVTDISAEAMQKLAQERDVQRFSALANRMAAPADTDKVAKFKAMMESPGGLDTYLAGLDNGALADRLLQAGALR